MVSGLVSVIMPTRDHGHFLPRSINALLTQTHAQVELLVVDDASSDDTREIVGAFAARDPRVKLITLTGHHGINRAVSVALPQAQGEFVYFAAADDLVAPTLFKKLVAQLQRHPD